MPSSRTYDVFLSHTSSDKPSVEELARRLKQEGIEPFLDKWNLVPGRPWQEALENALIASASCAVIFGADAIGAWHHEEMRAAIDHLVSGSRGKYSVIPVLLPGAKRPQDRDLPTFLKRMTWVDFAQGLDDDDAIHRLVSGIRGIAPGPGPGEAIFEGECPYRGLDAFDEDHARFFFGRGTQVDWLVGHRLAPMAQSSHARRFLAVLGASGSGKSSLARAGLIPALRAGKVEGSAGWPVVVLRPGYNPLENLAVAFSELGGMVQSASDIQALVAGLSRDRTTLHVHARLELKKTGGSRLIILIDQFEEIFTHCKDESVRGALIENLLHAATVVGGPTLVLLTMRVDFLGKCVASPGLAAALSDGQELVGRMEKDEMRLAIEQPAALAGLTLEPGLTDLLQEVQGQAGALPLLQYTLLELWNRRQGNRLTIDAYREIGGVQGALEHRADAILEGFQSRPEEMEICRRIFLRLTQPGEGTEDTRRRATFEELISSEAERSAVEDVIGKLADARLIATAGRDGSAPQPAERSPSPYIEVAHEALIRGWGQLRRWIDADRAGLRTHRQLTEAAQQWLEHDRDPAYLYMGSRLDVAREWVDAHAADPNPLERDFLDASLASRVRREAEERAVANRLAEEAEARRQAETRRAQEAEAAASRQKVLGRRFLAVAVVAGLLAVAAAGLAMRAYKAGGEIAIANANLQEQLYNTNIAVAEREITTNQDIGRADNLLKNCREELRGWEWHYLMRLRDGGRVSLGGPDSADGHKKALWGAEFSPDGKTIATVGIDGMLKIWDAAGGKLLHNIEADKNTLLFGASPSSLKDTRIPITCLAFSPDGKHIATGSFAPPPSLSPSPQQLRESKGLVRIWDVETEQLLESFTDPNQIGVILSVTYSPDGRKLASSSIDPGNTFLVRDLKSRKTEVVRGHTSQVHRLRYSPDGRLLAAAETNGLVKLWDAATLKEIRSFQAHPAPVVGIAFEPPDGSRFATAGEDGTIRVWETATLKRVHDLKGHTGSTLDVRYSPDGKRFASAGFDKTVRVWDSVTGKEKITLRGHDDTVWSVAFSPDGRRIVSAGFDKVARIWDATPREKRVGPGLFTVASSEAGGMDGVTSTPGGPAGGDHRVNSVAFSPDGRYLASGGWDNDVQLMDGETGKSIKIFQGHQLVVWSVAFSPDGRRLASASWDHTVKVWDRETGRELCTFTGHTAPVHSVAFSPDGRRLVSGGFDGQVKVWDAGTGKVTAHCDGFVFPILAVAFSPDGKHIASGGSDRSVKIWDADRGKIVLELKGHEASVHGLSYSPDGKRLVSGSWDRTLRVWNVDLAAKIAIADREIVPLRKRHEDRVHGVAFSPDGRWMASACEDKMARAWDANTGKEAMPPLHHRGVLWSVAFSPDGRRLAAGCWERSSWVKTGLLPSQ